MSRVVLGTIAPVCLMLLGWWGTLGLLGDSRLIPVAATGGLVLGLVADLTVLRGRMDSLFSLSAVASALVAGFYSFMIFGFFMGLPVPLLLVSVGWGYVAAHPPGGSPGERARRIRTAAWGSASIMLVACGATAFLAFGEPTIASQVRGMLGLPFTPSVELLAVNSLVGGLALVGLAYALPVAMAARADKRSGAKPARPCV